MLIVIGGMIGAGKTTVAELLGKKYGSTVLHENVENNRILPLFYTASKEEQERKRYSFLLQLEFLNSRFTDVKRAMLSGADTILDRSIYEDWYFAKVNTELGRISPEEFHIYEGLLNNMMEEIKDLPKKAPDLFIYLYADFDTIMDRIHSRGRDFEQDDELTSYYRKLWEGYDEWVDNDYIASPVLKINVAEHEVGLVPEQQQYLFDQVEAELKRLGVK
ncbi:deoxyadenosine/deoxycytidine kinase [Arcanobacterium wilhelmae]|uniref:Deoxyadenosine/deoxycytidine kinase n=1 Tax=Arcanobacterium wilhelmae TaxID=1803177 RepID=A0ABT9NCG3_9ACTO|nr:deoxynucleoside kinase [Arcanobacterium wilhelmae]MDP9801180.1 deoxyadenosine/deoxycytidine kinase [Arcanobacterium wilhelmae]WFN90532.1 deoxynucleoside kinase [Arcanobacterium wilhelmae]